MHQHNMRTQLLWKVDVMTPAPCPDADRRDPYTGERSMIGCAVAHFKKETREMDKSFNSEEEADEFMEKAPSSCYGWVKRPL